jgi:hypothetical protein
MSRTISMAPRSVEGALGRFPTVRRLLVLLVGAAALAAGCGDDEPSDGERAAAFCERLDRLTTNDPFAAFGDRATAGEVQAAFEALVARADGLLDTAPDEARAAARDYADAAHGLDSLLAGAAYDGAAVDVREYRDEQLRYVEAATRLERHLTSEC